MRTICSCIGTVTSPPNKCNKNCIYTPNMLITDQVTACDSLATISINPIVTKCSDAPNYSIYSYKNVTNVTINSLEITFAPVNNNYESGEIIYKVACGDLSSIGKIVIVYKDNCIDKTCTESQKCNKCTGLCENLPSDLSIGKTASTFSKNNGLKIG